MIGGVTVAIDDIRGDQEFLQALADRADYFPIAITYPSQATYQGTGQLTGEMPASSQSATMAIEMGGPGKLTKQ